MTGLVLGAVLGTLTGLVWVSVVRHFEQRREARERAE